MRSKPSGERLYLITDRKLCGEGNLIETVKAALVAGVRLVQLREKDLNARELIDLARRLKAVTAGYGAKLLVNDRADVAFLSGAEGVHLGRGSIRPKDARMILGGGALIGVSTHSVAEAVEARESGADFITLGPVYPTPSKAAWGPPLGTYALEEAVKKVSMPVYAIGGIKKDNLRDALRTGAHGVALISAVMASARPQASAVELLNEISQSQEPL